MLHWPSPEHYERILPFYRRLFRKRPHCTEWRSLGLHCLLIQDLILTFLVRTCEYSMQHEYPNWYKDISIAFSVDQTQVSTSTEIGDAELDKYSYIPLKVIVHSLENHSCVEIN